MTTVIIFKSNNQYKGFTCMGHAGYAKKGKDIVCAAISMLVINTINSIEELAGEKITTEDDNQSGTIECHFPSVINEKTKLLMDSMVLGLKEIEKEYSKKFFELIIKEV